MNKPKNPRDYRNALQVMENRFHSVSYRKNGAMTLSIDDDCSNHMWLDCWSH